LVDRTSSAYEEFRDLPEKQKTDQQSAGNDHDKKHQDSDHENPIAPSRDGRRAHVFFDDLIIAGV
jgi:hypothetical protein